MHKNFKLFSVLVGNQLLIICYIFAPLQLPLIQYYTYLTYLSTLCSPQVCVECRSSPPLQVPGPQPWPSTTRAPHLLSTHLHHLFPPFHQLLLLPLYFKGGVGGNHLCTAPKPEVVWLTILIFKLILHKNFKLFSVLVGNQLLIICYIFAPLQLPLIQYYTYLTYLSTLCSPQVCVECRSSPPTLSASPRELCTMALKLVYNLMSSIIKLYPVNHLVQSLHWYFLS